MVTGVPDPRTEDEDLCGVTIVGGTGIEWICIRPVHDVAYKRKRTDINHSGYASGTGAHPERFTSDTAPYERHYFVPRWPFREEN